jgi:hypothetical protein
MTRPYFKDMDKKGSACMLSGWWHLQHSWLNKPLIFSI